MSSSLVRMVRFYTNASETDVATARIVDALTNNSVRCEHAPIVWSDNPNTPLVGQIAIGRYKVEASINADDGHLEPLLVFDHLGEAVTDFTNTQDGRITLTDADLQGNTMYVTSVAYDPYGAAADIVTLLIALNSSAYDFKRGDQTFNRSQMVANLKDLRKQLRSRSITKRRGELVMRDQAGSSWY